MVETSVKKCKLCTTIKCLICISIVFLCLFQFLFSDFNKKWHRARSTKNGPSCQTEPLSAPSHHYLEQLESHIHKHFSPATNAEEKKTDAAMLHEIKNETLIARGKNKMERSSATWRASDAGEKVLARQSFHQLPWLRVQFFFHLFCEKSEQHFYSYNSQDISGLCGKSFWNNAPLQVVWFITLNDFSMRPVQYRWLRSSLRSDFVLIASVFWHKAGAITLWIWPAKLSKTLRPLT